MAKQSPPKKGPHRMASACKPGTPEEFVEQQMDAQIDAFAEKAHRAIEKARRKLTPAERDKADAAANAILDEATAAAKQARRRA